MAPKKEIENPIWHDVSFLFYHSYLKKQVQRTNIYRNMPEILQNLSCQKVVKQKIVKLNAEIILYRS